MNEAASTAYAWVYQGTWGVLTKWFKVPAQPPTLPFHDSAKVEAFRPAAAFLRYLRLQYWLLVGLLVATVGVGWLAVLVMRPIVGVLVGLPLAGLVVVPLLAAFLALHLRFDATWYVLTDRSLRIRRGIWTIHETTITFENIQNVTVSQGPLQRYFGIADVVVQTAGGGGGGKHGQSEQGSHAGVLEGLRDAPRIRDLIQARLSASRSAGLGDEAQVPVAANGAGRSLAWSPEHVATLRAIRDLVWTL